MAGADMGDTFKAQWPARRRHFMAGFEQQIMQALGPKLSHLLEDIGQFPQMVGIAQAVSARQVAVRLPAIVNQRAEEARENAEGVEGFFAPVQMNADPGQRGGGQDMHPVERTGNPHSGFIGMGDGGRLQCLADGRYRISQPSGGFLACRQHRGIRQRQPEEVTHQIAGARDRHHVVVRQMHHRRLDARAVLHRSRNAIGKLTPVNLAATAMDFRHPVFGDLMTQGRNIEYLAGFNHFPTHQGTLTDHAMGRRLMGFNVIGMRNAFQIMPAMPLLPTAGMPALLPFRFRLGLVQPVRGRRLAGITAVLRQSPFEFAYLGGQSRYLRSQILNLRKQRPYQVVLFGMTEPVKVGKFIHVDTVSICYAKCAE